MNAPAHDPQHDAMRQEKDNEAVDAYVQAVFGVEPSEDRSGLLLGGPAPPPGERDEDVQFEEYMRRYFPGSLG
jgi:hypothetical protein